MKAIELKGIIPPILTPMHDDESINVEELRRQVDRMIEGGVHALFPFGTNGEGYILNAKEKQLVLETVIEQCNGRVPVYAGTGCISTKETIEQSKMAQAAGADVLSIITPSFAAASQNELYEHYKGRCRRCGHAHCALQHPGPYRQRPGSCHCCPPGADREHHRCQGFQRKLHQYLRLHRCRATRSRTESSIPCPAMTS